MHNIMHCSVMCAPPGGGGAREADRGHRVRRLGGAYIILCYVILYYIILY